jgi:hypothetical protein
MQKLRITENMLRAGKKYILVSKLEKDMELQKKPGGEYSFW